MAEIIITQQDGRTLRRKLDDSPVVIGRDSGCDVWIDDPAASRRHARFARATGGFIVEDLGSKNGTLVNSEPCTHHKLAGGDEILIGSTHVQFQVEGAPTANTAVIIEEEVEPTSHTTRFVSGKQELVLPQERLKMIYELSERLTTLQGSDSLFASAMEICFKMLNFERGAIGVRKKDGKAVDWPVVRNLQGAGGELRISRTLLNRALEHGERAIFTESDGANADPTISIVQHGIRSAMCVPLLHCGNVLGVIYGDCTTTGKSYSSEDIDFLAGIAKQVSIGLINSRLVEEQEEMIRLNHEIDLARSIQTGLFPTGLPSTSNFKVAALNEPGNRVSGDYYDVIEGPDGKSWCIMADVTGEGVAASLLMANLQAAVRMTVPEATDPGELLSKWNRLIYRNTESTKFITCSLALVDPSEHRIRVALAGHFPPLIVRQGGDPVPLELEAGLPLGVIEDFKFAACDVEIGHDPFVFFCFTDGVTEAMNPDQEQFGMERLHECLASPDSLNPLPIIKHIRRSMEKFANGAPQSDDITMLAARVGAVRDA